MEIRNQEEGKRRITINTERWKDNNRENEE